MTERVISELRRRMIEDMTIRKLAPKTQHDYVQRVKEFAVFLGRFPDIRTLRTCVAFSCIWYRAAPAHRRSTRPSRRCGSSSMSRLDAPILLGR